jgi:hypothetical protein
MNGIERFPHKGFSQAGVRWPELVERKMQRNNIR